MTKSADLLLSIVVPLYNESAALPSFHDSLLKEAEAVAPNSYEIVYCDDGSNDDTAQLVTQLHQDNPRVKLICLSRNFGKENALSAGLKLATGQAILTVDGDGQHPVELIPRFMGAWNDGAQVVVGVRSGSDGLGMFKKLQSKIFYKLFNKLSGQKLIPGSTDFRLIDQVVQQAFLELKESDRVTRGLIDWLGFRRQLIYFKAKPRQHGTATYSQRKLLILGLNSLVSLSRTPLYIFGYLGIFITSLSFVLGFAVFLEQILLNDPWGWNFTGTAMLGILLVFLVGVVLLSQGILSLYISLIHTQSKQRPLFVIDYQASVGIKRDDDGQK